MLGKELQDRLHDIAPLVKTIEDSRKKVGPAGAIMFDAHCAARLSHRNANGVGGCAARHPEGTWERSLGTRL